MKPFISNEGRVAMAAAVARRSLMAFDFDGTLAPIVSRPQDARVPAPVLKRLERLAGLFPVAIISGRTESDVLDRLSFNPWRVVGHHGAGIDVMSDIDTLCAMLEPARVLLSGLRDELNDSGITVEDKRASIALHYRLARDRDRALRVITKALSGLPPELDTFGGKLVANIVVRGAHDKADALAQLVADSRTGGAIFVGDDINDEPVFARGESTWLTVRVGNDYLNSQAQFTISGVGDLPILLDMAIDAAVSAGRG